MTLNHLQKEEEVMKKLFLILVASLFFANGVWAATIYVDYSTDNCSTPSDNDYKFRVMTSLEV